MHILCTRGVIVDFRRIALWWRLAIQYLFSKRLLSMGIGKGYTTSLNRKVKERKMIVVWRGNICSFRLLFLLLKTSFWLPATPPPLHLRYLLLLSCSNVNLYGSSQDKCHADWGSSFPTIIKTLQGIKYFQISNLDNKNFGVRVASPASSSSSPRIVLFLSLCLPLILIKAPQLFHSFISQQHSIQSIHPLDTSYPLCLFSSWLVALIFVVFWSKRRLFLLKFDLTDPFHLSPFSSLSGVPII